MEETSHVRKVELAPRGAHYRNSEGITLLGSLQNFVW